MRPSWLFRIASHPRHGGGHLARGFALAAALGKVEPATFVLDAGADVAMSRARALGYRAVPRGREGAGPWIGIFVDSYVLDRDDLRYLADMAVPIVVMDDFLDPPDVASLAVNAAFHLKGDHIGDLPALLGPRFALVDPRFSAASRRPTANEVRTILVTFGRVDPDNATGLILRALRTLARRGFRPRVTILMGREGRYLDDVRSAAEDLPEAELLTDIEDVLPLLIRSDMVIGAGGVSLFERAACGVPSLTLTIADNQKLFVEGAVSLGVTAWGGASAAGDVADIADRIHALAGDRKRRATMSATARAAVDGRGPARVAEAMTRMVAEHRSGRLAANGESP